MPLHPRYTIICFLNQPALSHDFVHSSHFQTFGSRRLGFRAIVGPFLSFASLLELFVKEERVYDSLPKAAREASIYVAGAHEQGAEARDGLCKLVASEMFHQVIDHLNSVSTAFTCLLVFDNWQL